MDSGVECGKVARQINVFDLADDILELIRDEVFKLRKKITRRELKYVWKKSRRWRKQVVLNGMELHPGRSLLSKTPDPKNMRVINHPQKLFICGIKLNPFVRVTYSNVSPNVKHGVHLNISRKTNQGRIISMGLLNGWEDFKDQTDNTIVRYLIRREEDRTEY